MLLFYFSHFILFLILANLVLICIPLLTIYVECRVKCLLTVCVYSLEKCLIKSQTHFQIGLFVFLF